MAMQRHATHLHKGQNCDTLKPDLNDSLAIKSLHHQSGHDWVSPREAAPRRWPFSRLRVELHAHPISRPNSTQHPPRFVHDRHSTEDSKRVQDGLNHWNPRPARVFCMPRRNWSRKSLWNLHSVFWAEAGNKFRATRDFSAPRDDPGVRKRRAKLCGLYNAQNVV